MVQINTYLKDALQYCGHCLVHAPLIFQKSKTGVHLRSRCVGCWTCSNGDLAVMPSRRCQIRRRTLSCLGRVIPHRGAAGKNQRQQAPIDCGGYANQRPSISEIGGRNLCNTRQITRIITTTARNNSEGGRSLKMGQCVIRIICALLYHPSINYIFNKI